jgi:hypothetical protein
MARPGALRPRSGIVDPAMFGSVAATGWARSALGLWLGTLVGCNPRSDLPCSSDETCLGFAEGGRCEPQGFCSFPDAACPSGRRWHSRAPESLASTCLVDAVAGATDSETGTDSDSAGQTETSTTSTTSTSSSTTDDSTTTDPTDPSTSSTTDSPDSTGADLPSCDEQFSEAPDYELCAEEPTTCAFNVTVAMAIDCNGVCAMFGATCVTAQLNDTPLCVATEETTCEDMAFNDGICVCTRG